MKILVDGDACSVKKIIITVARKYDIEVLIFASINHSINTENYAKVIYVDDYSQAVDIKIANMLDKGDIVVTNDYGLASLVVSNKSYCISNRGQIFTNENINRFLLNRHITMDAKKRGHRIKGPRKRHMEDDKKFRSGLIKLIEK
ncbi:MAG: YaiI/YqxD family protein [Firmicutes bacterium]|nr:YaiI/YqxD family protein [Bacillota bacterium]